MAIKFNVIAEDNKTYARLGKLRTGRNEIETPVFMPVGTQATVKGLTPQEVVETGGRIILANAYHLYLRPGAELIKEAGGLHRFMNWPGSILTDSGGFQVFSLAKLNKINDNGLVFQSHIDGSYHDFTPEKAIQVQMDLGADIIMAFDQCTGFGVNYEQAQQASERTTRWAERCLETHTRGDQALFGIVQGNFYPELRERSLKELVALDFPGYALGGLSVGESREEMQKILRSFGPKLPGGKPRYLMGVGTPEDLLEGMVWGIDMFDCVFPTRTGRTGSLFTRGGRINIRNSKYKNDFSSLEAKCNCRVCSGYTKAYLHHLFRQKEILGMRLATYHNLFFLAQLMAEAREAIGRGDFARYRNDFLAEYQ